MRSDVFRRSDFTTGDVAEALGLPRQTVTDTIRRAHLDTSGAGSHARLTFAQAVAVGVARRMIDNGLHVTPAGHAARAATPALEEFASLLAAAADRGADGLSALAAEQQQHPWLVVGVSFREFGGHSETIVRPQLISAARLHEALPQLAPLMTVSVPLLPIMDRLARGLAALPAAES
ncbi:hypothetical protein [Falsiroseomonas ponticola]|uniref:hypothetical protein n=1 Tax=Falsiroseomonas ponticola TaxID=2786951 RepID=UPI001934608E|nr:hypothetical protein [Roseomonas ponticola]